MTANTYSSRHGAEDGVIRGILERIYRVWNDSLMSEKDGEPYLQRLAQLLSHGPYSQGDAWSEKRWVGRTVVFSGQQAPF